MSNESLKNAIWGAFVADAAAMGLHWLYDQKRIREVAPEAPEFRVPTAGDYEGVPSYFAHGHKSVGDLSHYGEQMLVMLRSLAANDGLYSKAHYQNTFVQHFGYGGEYQGYIDHPTRNTLDKITRVETKALKRARKLRFKGDDTQSQSLINQILALVKADAEDELESKALEIAGVIKEGINEQKDFGDYALRVLSALRPVGDYPGANDVQLPALSKLPPLIAVQLDAQSLSAMVESAVRVTNNCDTAVDFAHSSSVLMQAAMQGESIETSLELCLKYSSAKVHKQIAEALAMTGNSNAEVTNKIGMSCYLRFGVPCVAHNLATTDSYQTAIRDNIYAGGDSCGRAILLGAVLGATYGIGGCGIPQEWIDKLRIKDEIEQTLSRLFG